MQRQQKLVELVAYFAAEPEESQGEGEGKGEGRRQRRRQRRLRLRLATNRIASVGQTGVHFSSSSSGPFEWTPQR